MKTPYALGVIPARGGSKGLPGKNLRTLGALSLIGQAIASAREAVLLARFIVSGSLDLAAFGDRPNEEIIQTLTALRGLGQPRARVLDVVDQLHRRAHNDRDDGKRRPDYGDNGPRR